MRSDLRNILHPNDSSSYPTTNNLSPAPSLVLIPSPSTVHCPSAPPPPPAPASRTHLHHILHHQHESRSGHEPPHQSHGQSYSTGRPPPVSTSSWAAINLTASSSSLPSFHGNVSRGPASQISTPTQTPSSQTSPRHPSSSRDSSAHSATPPSNLDQSTTHSTSNSKSPVRSARGPTTPPSPSPSPIQQPEALKTPVTSYQSTATQTSFSGLAMQSPPLLKERPNSSQTVKDFSPDPASSHIYPSPHAESSPSHQSPSNAGSGVSIRHLAEGASSPVVSTEAKGTALPRPRASTSPIPVTDGKPSVLAWGEEIAAPTDRPCERCHLMRQAVMEQVSHIPITGAPPSSMTESLGKMNILAELCRTLKNRCEDCQRTQAGLSANSNGREDSQRLQASWATDAEENSPKGRKRKEPIEASQNNDRATHKHARLRSGSPSSSRAESPAALPPRPPVRPSPEVTDGGHIRRPNDPNIPPHLVGPHTAEILNLHGVPQRPHIRPPDDWKNMWSDAEYERKRKTKMRKDSVPVLVPARDDYEVAPH